MLKRQNGQHEADMQKGSDSAGRLELLDQARKAASQFQNDPRLLLFESVVAQHAGRLKPALRSLKRAIRSGAASTENLLQLARLQAEDGQNEAALETRMSSWPNSSRIWRNISVTASSLATLALTISAFIPAARTSSATSSAAFFWRK